MGWIKVAWINTLFDAFNRIAPNRAKDSDGTIGDTAHQGSPSGHNPDDTPGSKPEREDADNIAEVRAADVTSNLRQAGITMEMVVQSILATPAERDRLIYIIFNHRIWRKSNGWRQEAYSGSDPHENHAHFSGDPASDTDGGPWNSVLNVGGNMAFSQADEDLIRNAANITVYNLRGWVADLSAAEATRAAADKARDDANTAAITALTTALNAGGGNVDSAAIIAHMNQLAEQQADRDTALAQEFAQIKQQLTDAKAENDRLNAELSAAYAK